MATTTKKACDCPNINITPCESSQVHGFGYCQDTQTLAMQFKQKDGVSNVYHYKATPEMYSELQKASSKGLFFRHNIKPLDAIKVIPIEDTEAA